MIEGGGCGINPTGWERSDEKLGTGSKTVLSGIFGGVVAGISATPGVAGVVVSAPRADSWGCYRSHPLCCVRRRKMVN